MHTWYVKLHRVKSGQAVKLTLMSSIIIIIIIIMNKI